MSANDICIRASSERIGHRRRGGERLLLRVGRGVKARQEPFPAPACSQSPPRSCWRRNCCRSRSRPKPDRWSFPRPSRSWARAGIGLRPIVGQRKIELHDLRRQSLDLRVLASVDAVGRPDQKAGDQGAQERQKADDRGDHVARAAGDMLFRQHALQHEAQRPANEHGEPRPQSRSFSELIAQPPRQDRGS